MAAPGADAAIPVPAPSAAAARAWERGLLLCVMLLGGAAALLHEAVWFRVLTPALGAGALTAGAVSAGTLLGLSLGAAWGGRLAARGSNAWALLSGAELWGSMLCRLVPLFATALTGAVHAAPDGARGPAVLPALLLATVALTLAALPLGVSLPAAVAAWRAPAERGAPAFRWLYGVNTLGAVAGVLLGAGFALEQLGNRGSADLAQGLQIVAALAAGLAWLATRRRQAPAWVPAPAPSALATRARRPSRAALAAFLAGGAGLVIQIAWVRRLTPAVGTTTQSFATVLAAQLLALALGSLLLGPGPRATGRDRARILLLLAALPAALLPAAIEPVARAVAAWSQEAEGGSAALLAVRALAAAVLLIPSTILGAAALPWLLHRERARAEHPAATSGRLLAWNTAGSAAAALLAGVAWIPAVGTAAVLRGAGGLLLLAAALLLGRRAALLAGAAGLLLLAQPFVRPLPDAAGRDAVGASFLPAQFALTDAPPLHFAEGSATTVVVREREGHRELWVEGKIEASTLPTDRLHLALLGALPCALHPAPLRVGVIGLGTGRTAQAVAAFEPERLLVMELESEVVRAAGWFAAQGGGVPAGAEVVIGDARRTLTGSAERFDVLTSDPVHPGVAGSAMLYSTQQYALLAERLRPGGIVCQWLPLYQHTADDLRLALRTFAKGFAHTLIFQSGEDLILVGSATPVRVEEGALRARLAGAAGRTLAPLGLARPGRLLRLLLADDVGVRRFAGDGPLNTDDRLLLEFQAGRSWFVQTPYQNLLLLRGRRPDPATLLAAPPSAEFEAEVERGARHEEGVRAWLGGDPLRAAQAFGALAALDAEDRFSAEMRDDCRLLALAAALESGDPERTLADARALAAEPQLTARQRLDAAQALWDLGVPEEGRALARRVLEQTDSPRARRLAAP